MTCKNAPKPLNQELQSNGKSLALLAGKVKCLRMFTSDGMVVHSNRLSVPELADILRTTRVSGPYCGLGDEKSCRVCNRECLSVELGHVTCGGQSWL